MSGSLPFNLSTTLSDMLPAAHLQGRRSSSLLLSSLLLLSHYGRVLSLLRQTSLLRHVIQPFACHCVECEDVFLRYQYVDIDQNNQKDKKKLKPGLENFLPPDVSWKACVELIGSGTACFLKLQRLEHVAAPLSLNCYPFRLPTTTSLE